MSISFKKTYTILMFLCVGLLLQNTAHSEELEATAEPYKLVRSLQSLQDAVILGDHSSLKMQRFLLRVIDKRFREADPEVFENTRNVNAVLIYVMSGGNPKILSFLVERDVSGYFDSEVVKGLYGYFNSQYEQAGGVFKNIVKDYIDSPIGPYIALVAANVVSVKQPELALEYFDTARILAPSTLVEEASLRRAMHITISEDMPFRALKYANLYMRKYLKSPYASQFADMFVNLIVKNSVKIGNVNIREMLELIEPEKSREIYLRIARRSAILGLSDLARFSAGEAENLSERDEGSIRALAEFYSGIVNVSSENVQSALKFIEDIPDENLSLSDRALRDAARIVAYEVTREPQWSDVPGSAIIKKSEDVAVLNGEMKNGDDPSSGKPGKVDLGDAFNGFMSKKRAALDEIDTLLGDDAK